MRRRLRVIAGSAGSIPLKGPPHGIRPTTDRVREALFSSLGPVVVGVPFVDLYAGSGAVGIEALSRGASRCLFIERRRDCVQVIRANLSKVGLADAAEVVQADATRSISRVARWLAGQPGIIFADPPYADDAWRELVRALMTGANLPAGSIIVVEHAVRADLSDLPAPCWQRRFGNTQLTRWETE